MCGYIDACPDVRCILRERQQVRLSVAGTLGCIVPESGQPDVRGAGKEEAAGSTPRSCELSRLVTKKKVSKPKPCKGGTGATASEDLEKFFDAFLKEPGFARTRTSNPLLHSSFEVGCSSMSKRAKEGGAGVCTCARLLVFARPFLQVSCPVLWQKGKQASALGFLFG